MSKRVKKALEFATEKHKGQLDRAGKPYIEHPKAVAKMLKGEDEKIVAMLHDTVEDTDATIEEIRSKFGEKIADAVKCLTHENGVPYMDYIRGIKGNELARKVKLADLTHNMDLNRLPEVTDKDIERIEKYKEAYEFLASKRVDAPVPLT